MTELFSLISLKVFLCLFYDTEIKVREIRVVIYSKNVFSSILFLTSITIYHKNCQD